MLFSPPDLKSEKWLPEIPVVSTLQQNFDEEYRAVNVKLQQLATVNGLPNLKSYLSISGDVEKLNISDGEGKIFYL